MPRNIFIFNPETDYALASGRSHYDLPARIAKLKRDLQLTPALIASQDDCILVSNDFDPESYPDRSLTDHVRDKKIILIRERELHDISSFPETRILPWGWNHTLRRKLLHLGIPNPLLKSEEEIDALRELSHRRTTIPFQHYLQSMLQYVRVPMAHEFLTVDDALSFLEKETDVFFKAPWSSSGRGVLRISTKAPNYNVRKVCEWIGGFIKKQGSVMGEKTLDRVADFATEWMVNEGKAVFKGLSLFNTNDDGRYNGNHCISQTEIDNTLRSLSSQWGEDIIAAQCKALEDLIAPGYSGPAGIDMLITSDGKLNPCVEINLRFTMGMVALGPSILN